MNDPQTLEDIQHSLEQLYATQAEQQTWLTSPHPSFHGRTPQYVIDCGRADAVLMVLDMILTTAVG